MSTVNPDIGDEAIRLAVAECMLREWPSDKAVGVIEMVLEWRRGREKARASEWRQGFEQDRIAREQAAARARSLASVTLVAQGQLNAILAKIDTTRAIATGLITVDVAGIGVGAAIVASALLASAAPPLIHNLLGVSVVSTAAFASSLAVAVRAMSGSGTAAEGRETIGPPIDKLYEAIITLDEVAALVKVVTELAGAVSDSSAFLTQTRRLVSRSLRVLLGGLVLTGGAMVVLFSLFR